MELKQIPCLLRKIRKEKGMTLKEVRKATGYKLSIGHISECERSIKWYSIQSLDRLLKVYGYELDITKKYDHTLIIDVSNIKTKKGKK